MSEPIAGWLVLMARQRTRDDWLRPGIAEFTGATGSGRSRFSGSLYARSRRRGVRSVADG